MLEAVPESITKIDGQYMYEGKAAAYLVVDGNEAAFVDTVTRFSRPYLLRALESAGLTPEQ
ncbi:MAG: MBL fold metallo-hydrolase, partial [Candidatus Hydrogenedentes bacterium]|nr:MBL fold metallo-hydrolase [Candidatus Hydrogenedentota bacterium]